MSTHLFWTVCWWLPDTVNPEPIFNDSFCSSETLQVDRISHHHTIPVLKRFITKTLQLAEPNQVVVYPWEAWRGPLSDDVTFEDLVNGKHGEISRVKPLLFLLLGDWTFLPSIFEEGVLVRKMEEMKKCLPWKIIRACREEVQDRLQTPPPAPEGFSVPEGFSPLLNEGANAMIPMAESSTMEMLRNLRGAAVSALYRPPILASQLSSDDTMDALICALENLRISAPLTPRPRVSWV